jgi:NAD-dependent dihydropyrimidine dehydrogenase PreA subunit
MTHCIDCVNRSCVKECPVDCIYEGARALYIQPVECIDCGACVPPVLENHATRAPRGAAGRPGRDPRFCLMRAAHRSQARPKLAMRRLGELAMRRARRFGFADGLGGQEIWGFLAKAS